jgi:alpha-L-rhamnosidase
MGCIPPTLPGQTDEPEVENGAQPFERSSWIAAGPEAPAFDTTYPAPYFRKVFAVTAPVTRATAYVTAGGYFNLFLNGERVSDRYLDPAVTRYDKSVQYVTFDLTNSLAKGDNAIGVVLANGFYNVDTESAWQFDRAPWRNRPALRFVLHLEYADGRRQVIGSDASWRQITGPITFDQLRNGEYYDSRLRLGDWASPDYPDDDWSPAVAVTGPAGKLVPQRMPGIRKTRTLRPVAITEPEPGIYVVDFGQNIAGWARMTIDEEAGREVRMTYGERVYENGRLDIEELSRFIKTGETQTTRYLADGSGPREYEPSTTYFGFQYVEIEGLSAPPTEESIRAFMVHTALDTIGSFSTSDTLLNRIHENIRWSYLGNFHSFPEDCPHREKMGWTGDAQLVIETGLFNFDVQSAFVKWLGDFRDEQPASGALPGILPTSGWGYEMGHGKQPYYGPHWEGAAITIPWQVYRWRGDTAILRTNYPMMRRYLDFLDGQTEGNLLTGGIDDHKSIKTHTEGHYLSSAYYHWMLGIGADIAGVLDESDDATLLRQRARSVREAFNRKYYSPESGTYGNGGQTQLAVALGCNLVPDTRYAEVLTELITAIEKNDYHFDAGVIGVKKVIEVLLKNDRPDILHKLASQTGFPSFGYWIELGANTMWQNWDGSQSRNHIMFGSIGDYFYQGLAGIRPVTTAPGFREVDLRPYFPEDMRFLEASHHTPHGWLRTSWQREIDRITYTVTVPEGARASLAVPNGFRLESGPERSLRLPAGEHEVMLIQLK